MSKLNLLGLFSWAGACIVYLFETIASLVYQEYSFKHNSIAHVSNPEYIDWIDTLPWSSLQDCANYLVEMPIYFFLVCAGLFFFTLGFFFKKL